MSAGLGQLRRSVGLDSVAVAGWAGLGQSKLSQNEADVLLAALAAVGPVGNSEATGMAPSPFASGERP